MLDDRIDFLFPSNMWIQDKVVHIGVYNSEPNNGPIDFTIRMRDINSESTFPQDVRKWNEIYKQAHQGIDANDTSL